MSEVALRSLFSYLPSMCPPVLSEEMVIMIMDQLCITTAQYRHTATACYCVLIYQLGSYVVHGKIDQVRQRIKFLWAKSHYCTVSILMRIMGNDANEIDDGFFKSKKQKRVTWLPCRNHSSPNLLVGGLDSPRGYTLGPNPFKAFIKEHSLF